MHDSCPDCAGTQPKRTIIPVYPESQSVTRWARASYLPRQPNTREAERAVPWGGRGAGARDAAVGRGGEGAACPGRGGLAWAGEGAGCPGRGGWPGEMCPYRLPGRRAIRLLELLSGVREDHPKVVLE
jgi:hypothetical protein